MTHAASRTSVEIAFGKTWQDTVDPNGMSSDGTGDLASSPSAAAFQQTGKIEIRVRATSADWTPAAEWTVLALWDGGGENQYKLAITTSGELKWYWSTDGSATSSETSSAALSLSAGTHHLAATFAPATGDVHSYTYPGGWSAPLALADWTEVGTVQSSGATSVNSGSSVAKVGEGLVGTLHSVELWAGHQSASGTIAAAPRFHDIAQWAIGDAASTAVADAQGNTWTLVANAAITGSWIDVTGNLQAHSYGRGRLHETGTFEAGTAQILLTNNSRQYEPDYASGTYYPDVVPWVPIRINVAYASVGLPVFTGFVEGWELAYSGGGKTSTAALRCTDGLRMLNRVSIAQFENEVLTDSPLGWWKLDEASGTTAADSGSAGDDGTYVNTPTLGQTGPRSNLPAVNFDDSATEEVAIGTLTGSDLAADFSVGFWINADSGDATATQAILELDVAGSDSLCFYLDRSPATPVLGVQAPTTTSGVVTSTAADLPISEDTWHYVVVTVDISAKTFTPYADGVLGGPVVLSGWDQTRTTGTMSIKIAEATGLSNFDGLLAQVWIDAGLIPRGRIQTHYHALYGPFDAETYDARVGTIMSELGWGGGTLLDASTTTLTAVTNTRSSALAAIRRAELSESASVFVGKEGRLRGHARHYGILKQPDSIFTHATNFSTFLPGSDVDRLYNQVTLTLSDGTVITAENAASRTSYGASSLSRSKIDLGEVLGAAYADEFLTRFKDPAFRAETLTYHPDTDAANLWAELRDREIGDRITLAATPPGGAGALSIEMFIERIGVAGSLSDTRVTYQLSPASASNFWVLDHATLSVLGTSTIPTAF